MNSLPAPPARRRRTRTTLRAAAAAGLAAALLLWLGACKSEASGPLTPAGAALVASAPAVAAARVPPPPALPSTGTLPAGELASVDARLESTLAGASACTVDTECHAVAIGAMACGGPTGYRAYSDKTVSTASVDALAQQQRALAAAAARASHQVSPCFMLADPGARCQQHRCVTGRSAP
jgi:hypothetical protein